MDDSVKFILAPSILAADFSILGKQILQTKKYGARYIHIDVMDGVFVPSISFGIPVVETIRPVTDQYFDVHLMVVEPEKQVKQFVDAGADGITFHVEATKDPKAVIDLIHRYGKKAGLSLKPGTPLESIYEYLPMLDLVLVMSVEPGQGGQAFMKDAYDRIRRLREFIDAKGLRCKIEVDGGICKKNVKDVLKAGAHILVAGSAVFKKKSIRSNIKMFDKAFEACSQ